MGNSNFSSIARGFTLIEVMVSMTLFVIGFLSIYALQINAYSSLSDMKHKKQAMFFASSYREIQYLKTNVDIAGIHKQWFESVKKTIPAVNIKESVEDSSISLLWPSYLSAGHCQPNYDCINL